MSEWMDRAACRNADPERMQPETATQADIDTTVQAFCHVCPVRAECAQLARSQDGGAYGIHGGTWWGPPPREPALEVCAWCEGPMEAATSRGRYCSGAHRMAAHRARLSA